jgi:hypothetical protein
MEQSEATMETRRWFQLAAALVLGVLIGYGIARSMSPETRYMVGPLPTPTVPKLYRCDTYTGRTWVSGFADPKWFEIPDQVVSPRNEE